MDKQTEKCTDECANRERDKWTDECANRHTNERLNVENRQTNAQIHRQRDRLMYNQTNGQMNVLIDRGMDR